MSPPSEHALEIQTWQPLHAGCSCGLWSMACVAKGFLTLEEALAEAREAHEAHVQDMERRQRLRQTIYPKGGPSGRKV